MKREIGIAERWHKGAEARDSHKYYTRAAIAKRRGVAKTSFHNILSGKYRWQSYFTPEQWEQVQEEVALGDYYRQEAAKYGGSAICSEFHISVEVMKQIVERYGKLAMLQGKFLTMPLTRHPATHNGYY